LANALLVTPSDRRAGFEYRQAGRENLGVEYLLSVLRLAGHWAESINENLPGERSVEAADLTALDIIGFSLPFWEYRCQYVDLINRVASQVKCLVVAGGHAATIGAEYFLSKCPNLEGVVMGEGETTLVQLLTGDKERARVPGYYTREGFTRRPLGDIDDLPFPTRDELLRSSAAVATFKEAYIASTRGCTNVCAFCSIPTYYRTAHGSGWRERSVEKVCAEVTQLLEICPNLEGISFTDDNFLGFRPEHKTRAIRIAEHIASVGHDLAFEIACRAEAVDHDTFGRLSDLGLSGVYLGIESGVQRILDVFRKRTTVEQNMRSIEVLSNVGVGCDVGFIMFSPTITLAEVRQNLYFLLEIIEKYPVFVHPASVFRSLRDYPTDLGRAAAAEQDDHLASLPEPLGVLQRAMDLLWQRDYEAEFLQLEQVEALQRTEQGNAIENARSITCQMIGHALWMVDEVERFHPRDPKILVEGLLGQSRVGR
jgi:radical SAM superfamily enzyme YgiQ (UPF0313 family)